MCDQDAWPHLIGKPVDIAVEEIKRDNPNLHIVKLPEGSPVTHDLQFNRVRVFFDKNGNVSNEPQTG
ncbi:unnamed protein product [Rotaria sp. Silwood2]|nr:unnamed protein product [Rotaria sp. Silwood2]CAF4008538.1 unnamed protein product [Rotaria sp. Silwood2]CAF4021907.1 unnamed protein product [Rotaria sp. Silwood2]CAF4178231.1 unnamed protein product [Rotaria sp. Silwood2]